MGRLGGENIQLGAKSLGEVQIIFEERKEVVVQEWWPTM